MTLRLLRKHRITVRTDRRLAAALSLLCSRVAPHLWFTRVGHAVVAAVVVAVVLIPINSPAQQHAPGMGSTTTLPTTHTAGVPGQTHRSYVPPVHVSPPVRESYSGVFVQQESNTRFTQTPPQSNQNGYRRIQGPIGRFTQSQLSSESLLKRNGPGLQDRISKLIDSSRYQLTSATAGFVERVDMAERRRTAADSTLEARSLPDRTSRQNVGVGSTELMGRPVHLAPNRVPNRNYADRPPLNRIPKLAPSDLTIPANVVVSMEDRVDSTGNSPTSQLPEALHDHRIQPTAATEPVLSDPVEDPFGDFPPLRPTVRHANERSRDLVAEPDEAVSVLDLPKEKDSSLGADTQYDYAPTLQDDSANNRESVLTSPVDPQDEVEDSSSSDPFGQQNEIDDFEELPGQLDENRLRRMDQDLNDEINELQFIDPDDPGSSPAVKSCDEFRSRLLNSPLSTISLDVSPPKSKLQTKTMGSRTWRDRGGNEVGEGTMAALSRGYVILDGGEKLAYARLGDADLAAIAEFWQIPLECPIGNDGFVARSWAPQTVTWKASSLCHKPLFFEDIKLERYGHSYGPFLQPVESTVHFFKSLLFLPYQTALSPPDECQYALGFYRPGDCAPWLKDPIPFSLGGITRQTLVMLGIAYIP